MGDEQIKELQERMSKLTVKECFGKAMRFIHEMESVLLNDACDDKDRQIHAEILELRRSFSTKFKDWEDYRKANPKDKDIDNSNHENEY